MKKIRKIAALAFAATLVIGAQGSAAASDIQLNATSDNSIISPRFTDIAQYSNNFEMSSAGVLSCYAKTNVYYPSVAGVKVELQKNGSTIKTWTAKGGIFAIVDETYSVSSGSNTYRLRVTHSAYDTDDNLLETFVSYSDEITY